MCAYFEATQLAGFSETEAKTFFGKPPRGLSLTLKPLATGRAQAAFLARFNALSDEKRA